jgi:hypothetical protein
LYARAQHLLRLADVARNAHRPDHRVQPRADAQVALHLARRLAHGLDDERDRAARRVEVGDRQRNSLAVLMLHHDHELAGLGGFREHRMVHLEQIGNVGKIFPIDDFEVGHRSLS